MARWVAALGPVRPELDRARVRPGAHVGPWFDPWPHEHMEDRDKLQNDARWVELTLHMRQWLV